MSGISIKYEIFRDVSLVLLRIHTWIHNAVLVPLTLILFYLFVMCWTSFPEYWEINNSLPIQGLKDGNGNYKNNDNDTFLIEFLISALYWVAT